MPRPPPPHPTITYKPNNDVIKQYLARVLVKIKAKQDEILNDYAASCITDVNSCLSQNNYPSDTSSSLFNNTQANIAINACRANIITCMSVNGYSIDNPTPTQLANWVCGIIGGANCSNQYVISYNCGDGSGTPPAAQTVTGGAAFTAAQNTCSVPTAGNSTCSFKNWRISGTNTSINAGTSQIYSYTENKTLTANYLCSIPQIMCVAQTGYCVSLDGVVGTNCYNNTTQNEDTCVCGSGNMAHTPCPNQVACSAAGGTWNNNSCQ